ncbi:MAG: hypothetical protein EBQ56_17010 [Proteobacteria bacterium]|nr:hypothetical protein [Pseudomonadota bacterium]
MTWISDAPASSVTMPPAKRFTETTSGPATAPGGVGSGNASAPDERPDERLAGTGQCTEGVPGATHGDGMGGGASTA